MTLEIVSTSSEDTERLGERLGSKLKGGEVIELVSDLGGGKTTFVRGLARGMGSTDHVSSPTFKISNVYSTEKLSQPSSPTAFPGHSSGRPLAEPVALAYHSEAVRKLGPKLELHHFDFYRLSEAGIIADELAEVINDPQAIAAIEWGAVVQNVLPKSRLTLTFTSTSQSARTITINYPKSLDYLIK